MSLCSASYLCTAPSEVFYIPHILSLQQPAFLSLGFGFLKLQLFLKRELGNLTLSSLLDIVFRCGKSATETQKRKVIKIYAVQGLDNLS